LSALALLLLTAPCAQAQWIGKQSGCYSDKIQNNPNRPTVANPADITQYGVLEIEYGWDHGWPAAGQQFNDAAGLLKFGVLCDVELRWTTTSFLAQTTEALGTQRGFGDNWLGPQLRFYRQTTHVPSMAVGFAVKIPSASSVKGLGSGRVDYQLTLLASKDLLGVHFDFNVSQFWIGRPTASGFDTVQQMNLAFGQRIYRNLQFQGEFYGNTTLNSPTPAFSSGLAALVWNVTKRLEIDAGMDTGMTHDAPRRRIFVGFTYSIANLYEAARKNRSEAKAEALERDMLRQKASATYDRSGRSESH
jgi:hypothetical protein